MSFVTTARVNDYEIGNRRSEMQDVRNQIRVVKSDKSIRPDERSKMLRDLKEHFDECSDEYKELCREVRRNFI